jgi:hypothetical protein
VVIFLFNPAYAKDILISTYRVSLWIILQKFIQRSLIRIGNNWRILWWEADVLLLWAESKLYEVTQGNIKRSSETAQSLVGQKRIEEIAGRAYCKKRSKDTDNFVTVA